MLSTQETVIRLLVAAVLGSLVGIERQRLDWAAGLRTHMLVCLGSALTMIVSAYGFAGVLGTPHVDLDPSRVAAQVISGIGFLGAGTILFLKHEVIKGLTTAAGLWTVAGIGLAVGGGMYVAAAVTTLLVLFILVAIKPAKKRINRINSQNEIYLITGTNAPYLRAIAEVLEENKMMITYINIRPIEDPSQDRVHIKLGKQSDQKALLEVISALRLLPDVLDVNWKQ